MFMRYKVLQNDHELTPPFVSIISLIMPRVRSLPSLEQNAADAAHTNQTKQRRRQLPKNNRLQALIEPRLGEICRSAYPLRAVSPLMHPALGQWPENWAPNIVWNLAKPKTWLYRRQLSDEELEETAFLPPQERMLIVINFDHSWVANLEPRPGYNCMTLGCFREAMIKCMQQPVSRGIWDSASVFTQNNIAKAHYLHTGDLPVIPCMEMFTDWNKHLLRHPDNPEVRDTISKQLTEYVTRDCSRNATRLQTVDLFGLDFMFAGLTFLKEPNIWFLNMTSPHVARMAIHVLPGAQVV